METGQEIAVALLSVVSQGPWETDSDICAQDAGATSVRSDEGHRIKASASPPGHQRAPPQAKGASLFSSPMDQSLEVGCLGFEVGA